MTVPALAAGAVTVEVTSGAESATAGLTVLGERSITVSPTTVDVGGEVTVDGSQFDPTAAVSVFAVDGADAQLGDANAVAVGADGSFTGRFVDGC